MKLSSDIISQFVKVTKNETKEEKQTFVYGTVVEENRVKLDGSDLAFSVITTSSIKPGNRVLVMIKNHQATIVGNVTERSISNIDISDTTNKVKQLEADNLKVNNTITSVIGDISYLKTHMITGDLLNAKDATIGRLEVSEAELATIKANYITAEQVAADYATIENLQSVNLAVYNLESVHAEFEELTTEKLDAHQATIDKLNVTYANIDFSNIENAAIEHLFTKSGLIENVIVGDGTITGNLVGVTIKGDLIEGNTIVADKLVIQGEDGLYYKLNTNGVTTEAEQTEYNSLNGSIITAKSITATQVSVDDLVAFDATIGGFNITENSIHSEVKDSEGNTTRGIYMDTDGQVNFGDETNFIKYYKDEDGTYKLIISAANILYALNGKQYSITDLGRIGDYVHIGTYEDEPCIELGESDSDFKLIITNTRIMFMEGTTVPAYINNQSLHITKAVIEEEIQQGEFVWKVRDNGNMGLMWKGDT